MPKPQTYKKVDPRTGVEYSRGKPTDLLRQEAMARNDDRGVRILTELEDMLKLCRFQREALQNECMDGMGYKQLAADLKTIQKTEKLAMAYVRLTEAQIKLNKHLKEVAEMMTPEEEKTAVKKYIQAMEVNERSQFISKLIDWHNSQPSKAITVPPMRSLEEDAARKEARKQANESPNQTE